MRRDLGLALAAVLPVTLAAQPARRAADLVLLGGRIFTADSARPWAEALAVRDSLIVAVGTVAEVERHAGPRTRRVQLGGRVVVPGINDAHAHVLGAGGAMVVGTAAAEPPDPPLALVVDSLRAAARRAPAGTVLRVYVGAAILDDSSARRAALDAAAPDHPVWLTAWSGHGAVLNSAAMRALGIGESPSDPAGGWFERDSGGRPTGLLHEYAWWNLRARALSALTDSALAAQYRAYGIEAAALGITSAQDLVELESADRAARVASAGRAPIRLRLIRRPTTDHRGRRLGPWPRGTVRAAPGVTLSGVKYIIDGTPVEAMAAEREDYADRPGHRGRLNFPPDTIRAMLSEALRARQQPLLHLVGDSSAALALSLMTSLGSAESWRPLRPRFEHGDGLMPDLLGAARRMGVVVVQNPTHFTIVGLADRRYAPARRRGLQPLRSLLDSGVVVALGSDGPMNPFLNVMLATLHPDNPAEALSREQAVTAYTLGSAYAEHEEARKGRLAPGMLADLAVLSQDVFGVPPNALPATVSVLTLVGGTVVHDAGVVRALPASPRLR